MGRAGCPRCLQEERLAHREEEQAFWHWFRRWALRLLIPALLVSLWLAPKPDKVEPDRLDPESYRKAIETVESVLYRGDRLTADDRVALADGLQALSIALHQSRPSLALRRAIEGMDQFLTVTAFESSQDRLDVVDARKRWEVLRAAHFQSAEWFERSSQALEEAQTSTSARGVPPDVDRYEQSLDQMRALIDRVQTYVEQLPENRDDLDGDTYDRWQADRKTTAADVQRVREGFPLKRTDVDQSWRKALNDLEKALDTASRIVAPDPYSPTLVPNRSSGLFRVRLAQGALQKARESVAAALR
jgi:hypothetical protein